VTDPTPAPEFPEHWFRHEFGRLVSVLSRRFGVHRVEVCEDAAQTALLRAVEVWPNRGLPDDKSAWLFRVATNHVLDALRREKRTEPCGDEVERAPAETSGEEAVRLEGEVQDDQLRLLFVCADPAIPLESQMVLALKTMCGFSTAEIARRFFQSEEAIHKRLQRARATLRERAPALDTETPPLEELAPRLPAVLHILYLLFTEGYSSAQPDRVIRRELCEEAVRLGLLLVEHAVGAAPATDALLALMYLNAARFEARVDGAGGLLLLEEQDRARWDAELIHLGLSHLARASRGDALSRYHVEAGIAAEHCLAPSYEATRWEEIARLYEILDDIAPSPVNTLNRAIAVAAWKGPAAALALIEALRPPSWLVGYYLWDATLGELHRRNGDHARAVAHLTDARDAAPTQAEKALLQRRLRACSGGE
jgi:RNA polymerase sigma-70 factor (ECF subfamily)